MASRPTAPRSRGRGPGLRLRLTLLATGLTAFVSAALLWLGWLLVGSVVTAIPNCRPAASVRIQGVDVPAEQLASTLQDNAQDKVLQYGTVGVPVRGAGRRGAGLGADRTAAAPVAGGHRDRAAAVRRIAGRTHRPARPARRGGRTRRHLRRHARPVAGHLRGAAPLRGQRQPRTAHPALGHPHRTRRHPGRRGRRRRRTAQDGRGGRQGRAARRPSSSRRCCCWPAPTAPALPCTSPSTWPRWSRRAWVGRARGRGRTWPDHDLPHRARLRRRRPRPARTRRRQPAGERGPAQRARRLDRGAHRAGPGAGPNCGSARRAGCCPPTGSPNCSNRSAAAASTGPRKPAPASACPSCARWSPRTAASSTPKPSPTAAWPSPSACPPEGDVQHLSPTIRLSGEA